MKEVLGHYELGELLGRGGMGEVRRARDPRLGRDVAIKLLPEDFADDAERVGRFEREARVLASLNHPNIAAIHDIGQEGDRCFLVLELVEGETLADRIARGPLPLEQALEVARRILDALEAAHGAGVIHRDLKPANVRLTPAGDVKLLDFGLAKHAGGATQETRDGARGGVGGTRTPTTATSDSFAVTRDGVILGTPVYMSPEQARGLPVDERTDVWAFGCVLYEMLSGRRAFGGESTGDVLAAVLEHEPNWSALPAGLPASVERLLRRCLAKEARRRLRDAADARLELTEDALREVPAAGLRTGAGRSGWLPWALLLLTLLALVPLALRSAPAERAEEREPRRTRFTIELPPDSQLESLHASDEAVVYTLNDSWSVTLHARPFEATEARKLVQRDMARDAFLSPDGRWVGFHGGGRMHRVSIEGGPSEALCGADNSGGSSWFPDGRLVSALDWGRGLFELAPGASTMVEVVPIDEDGGERAVVWPQALADGRTVIYTAWRNRSFDEARIVAVRLDTGQRKLLVDGGTYGRLVPIPGGAALLWARSGALWARGIEPETLAFTTDAIVALEDVVLQTENGRASYAVSPGGTLAFQRGGAVTTEEMLVWVGLDGSEEPVLPDRANFEQPSLSADGRRLCVTQEGATYSILVGRLDVPFEERVLRRFTHEADAYAGRISPDGERLLFVSNLEGDYRMYVQDFDGTDRRAVPIPTSGKPEVFVTEWSVDDLLLGHLDRYDGTNKVVAYDLTGGESTGVEVLLEDAWGPALSPDGRWVACTALDADLKAVLIVVSYPDGSVRCQAPISGLWAPRWTKEGDALLARTREHFVSVPFDPGPPAALGRPVQLFADVYASATSASYDVGPDGRILAVRRVGNLEATEIEVVENWTSWLARRLAE